MTFRNIKILFMMLLLCIVFTSCSDSTETVALVQPQYQGNELPLEIWSTVKLKKLSMKWNSCVVDENGESIEVGTKVLVLEKANCDEVIYNLVEPSVVFRTGLIKIRVIDTGQEGYTWSSAAGIQRSTSLNE